MMTLSQIERELARIRSLLPIYRHRKQIVHYEERIPALYAKAGASAPTSTTRAIGASGGVLLPVQSFSKTTQQDLHFFWHCPEDLVSTNPVYFHLMWLPGASHTTGNYLWKVEYLTKTETGDISAGTPTIIDEDITPTSATTLIETEFADAITGLSPDDILVIHLYRDVGGDNGDDVGQVYMVEIEYDRFVNGESAGPAVEVWR